jgi:hypothetical protein
LTFRISMWRAFVIAICCAVKVQSVGDLCNIFARHSKILPFSLAESLFFIGLLLWKALWESLWLFLRINLIINGKTEITIAHKRSIYCRPIPIYFRPEIGILSRDPPFKVGPLFWYVNTQWLPRAPSSTTFVSVYWGLQEKRKKILPVFRIRILMFCDFFEEWCKCIVKD